MNPLLTYRYPILLISAEIFGLLSLILIGLIFDKNHYGPTFEYDWTNQPFSYHPLMMTIGLLFSYGNAIILYRTLKHVPKYKVKLAHAICLLGSLVFTIVGFVAIIRQKNLGNASHFMTFHSWLGLTTIILFFLQWICGFVCFLIPQMPIEIRKLYMPSHRLWGKVIFISSVVIILTGVCEHGTKSSYAPADDSQRSRRLLLNFFGVFTSLFSLIIIYLLSNPEYQRPPDNNNNNNNHQLKPIQL